MLAVVTSVISVGVLLAATAPLASSRTFTFSYVAHVAALPDDARDLRLWIPVPQPDREQEISEVVIDSPASYKLHKDPEYRNEYAYFDVKPGAVKWPLEITLRFRATRHEHRVALDEPAIRASAPVPTTAELQRYLQPDRLVPLRGQMAQLAAQETAGLTHPLDKARAIYKYVVATMRYDKTGEGWGRGDAIYACTAKKGNCTDFHSLFIGMMRAAGVPARFEIGFSIPQQPAAGPIAGYHCWAEFYLAGIGWVPVDASEAWKNPPLKDYFFGAHDANRILFTLGRDIRFDPPQAGDPANYFVYPFAELDGKPFSGVKTEFSFRDLGEQKP